MEPLVPLAPLVWNRSFRVSPERHSQWAHPEDGQIYKQRGETAGGTRRPILTDSSQVVEVISSPSCPAGWQCCYHPKYRCWCPVRRLTQEPVHPIISCGWDKAGGRLLERYRELCHRIDLVFDIGEHLDWHGTKPPPVAAESNTYEKQAISTH